MTIFEKIARREIPADIMYEEEDFLVIRDIHPQAPVHVLMFPRKVIPRVGEAGAEERRCWGRCWRQRGRWRGNWACTNRGTGW